MIKKLGNKLLEISSIYDELTVRATCDLIGYHNDNSTNLNTRFLIEQTKLIFACEGEMSSFYFHERDDQCGEWHVDGGGYSSMIISSYPNPTEILIPKTLAGKHFNNDFTNGCSVVSDMERLISSGDFELFIPEPGDIYFLDKQVIHRRNLKALGTKHLMLRMWNPIGV